MKGMVIFACAQLLVVLLLLLLLSRFSHVRLCATPEMAAHQAPPSLGFSRQEYWSVVPFPSPVHGCARDFHLRFDEVVILSIFIFFSCAKLSFKLFENPV